jgi:hypothetical protein
MFAAAAAAATYHFGSPAQSAATHLSCQQHPALHGHLPAVQQQHTTLQQQQWQKI